MKTKITFQRASVNPLNLTHINKVVKLEGRAKFNYGKQDFRVGDMLSDEQVDRTCSISTHEVKVIAS